MIFLFTITGFSQYNVGKDKLAVDGYDVVAYFENMAVQGSKDLTTSHNGIQYRFSSRKNLEAFSAQPEKYLPKYGGWCAYAMAQTGDKVEINPKTFKIINGELYLFYNKLFNNTLDSWNKNERELLPKADSNWARLNL